MRPMIAEPAPPRFELLTLELDGGMARLMLNRPGKLNALSPALMREIIAAARWLATLDTLRLVLVGGEGRAFCAGFDLGAMRETRTAEGPEGPELGLELVQAIEALPAITLAAVQGHCIGGGGAAGGRLRPAHRRRRRALRHPRDGDRHPARLGRGAQADPAARPGGGDGTGA